MYLARKRTSSGFRYFLRISRKEGPFWKGRDLIGLGPDPSIYIRYPGGKSFYIDEALEETIKSYGIETDQWELERLFFRFVKSEIREALYFYIDRGQRRPSRLSREEQLRLQEKYHSFDKRRLLFLKFGCTNVEGLLERPLSFLNQLQDKSRDEIEQLIWDKEDRLRPKEVVAYIYTAFALWEYFPGRISRFIPEAALIEELDRFFLEALCKVAEDEGYRMGLSEGEVLREYLYRYVILYFDHTEAERQFFEDRQQGKWWRREVVDKAARYFGFSPESLEKLSRKELLAIFRAKAKELHPDRGGDKEAFIRLRKLFEELMAALGYQRRTYNPPPS